MNLYLLKQDLNNDYDTYDSCVVAADNEEDARNIHPSDYVKFNRDGKWFGEYADGSGEYETENSFASWVQARDIGKVKVELIGTAAAGVKKGVILSSFNAG